MTLMTFIGPEHLGHVNGSIFPDQVRDRLQSSQSACPQDEQCGSLHEGKDRHCAMNTSCCGKPGRDSGEDHFLDDYLDDEEIPLSPGKLKSKEYIDEYINPLCQRLAENLNYLEEPLKAIEVDGASGTAILRSYPPVREGDTFLYYEIRIRGSDGIISLRRRKKHGSLHQDFAEKAVLGYHHSRTTHG